MSADIQRDINEIPEHDDKIAQLNLLLDKAKMYSQFIGQQIAFNETIGKEKKDVNENLPEFDNNDIKTDRILHNQPELITGGILREYQLEGMNWLIQLYENGMNGILADEMGLGKTVMTISFLAYLWIKGVKGPFLIVAPLSTLENWINEINHWAPDIPCILYHGPKSVRDEVKKQLTGERSSAIKKRKIKESQSSSKYEFPIVVTSYEIAINDRKFFQKYQWKYLIVDEGHRLKNFNCRLIQELRILKTDNRLLLTGTPLQNNLKELWSLLNFILPDVFDSLENFQSWFDFDEVVEKDEANGEQIEDKMEGQLVEKLHSILQPFLLRRLKQDLLEHLEIPIKKHLVIYCPFTHVQKEFYNTLKEYGTNIFSSPKSRLQNLLMQLRKVCNHPFLFDSDFDDFYMKYKEKHEENGDSKKKKASESSQSTTTLSSSENYESRKRSVTAFQLFCNDERERAKNLKNPKKTTLSDLSHKWKNLSESKRKVYEEKAEEEKLKFKKHLENQRLKNEPHLMIHDANEYIKTLKQCSGKIELLDRMLPILKRDGHKCLIFSQMTRMLDILEDYLELSGYKYCRIDGSIARDERQVLINKFNTDDSYFCFLLSTRAGGLGINLTSADTVIIYDSDWNPQMDLQAQDRCHRIGQTKPVVVYRLITANSVESKILKRANAKIKLERLVIHKERFKGKGSKIISDKDVFDILQSDEIDASLGGDKVISDEDLLRVLNRQECISMFEEDKDKQKYQGIELMENEGDGQVVINIQDNVDKDSSVYNNESSNQSDEC